MLVIIIIMLGKHIVPVSTNALRITPISIKNSTNTICRKHKGSKTRNQQQLLSYNIKSLQWLTCLSSPNRSHTLKKQQEIKHRDTTAMGFSMF